MKIVIDISEDIYTRLFDNGIQNNEIAVDDVCEMARAIRKGYPVKNHSKRMAPDILNHLIGAEVLDKIRVELHTTAEMHEDGDFYLREEWIDEIFDKYNPLSYCKMTENCKDEEQNPFWTFK